MGEHFLINLAIIFTNITIIILSIRIYKLEKEKK